MKYIHIDCLEQWRSTNLNANLKCMTCNTFYKFKYGQIRCNQMYFNYFFDRHDFIKYALFLPFMIFLYFLQNYLAEYRMRKYCPEKENNYIVQAYISSVLLKVLHFQVVMFISLVCMYGTNQTNYIPLRLILLMSIGWWVILTSGYPFLCDEKDVSLSYECSIIFTNITLFTISIKNFIRYNIETFQNLYGFMREKSILNY